MEKKFSFNKEESMIVKGIAIILMIIHHLFAFPDRIVAPSYYMSIPVLGNNIAYYLGVFGRICVAIYLFISGYGLYLKYSKQNNFEWIIDKVKNFLINYWLVIFLVFIPLGVILKEYELNIKELILNLTCIKISYISSWWFVRIYFELLILFPILIKVVDNNLLSSSVKGILAPVIFTVLRQNINIINNPIINIVFEIITYMPLFMIGVIFAKFDIFQKINELMNKYKINNIISNLSILLIVFVSRCITSNVFYLDLIYVPIFIYVVINIISLINTKTLVNLFLFLGVNSTNLWLIHDIFLEKYFQSVVYYPRVSILILAWILILILPISILLNKLMKYYKSIRLSYSKIDFQK